MSTLTTARLRLRPPEAEDAAGYRRLFLDPRVEAWLRPPPLAPFSAAEAERRLAQDRAHWAEHGFGPAVVLEREGGGFVGRAGLRRTEMAGEPAVEVAWALVPERWGAGLATEAAGAAIGAAPRNAIEEVVACTLPANAASRRVMEKLGMRLAGEVEHAGLPHLLFRLGLG